MYKEHTDNIIIALFAIWN